MRSDLIEGAVAHHTDVAWLNLYVGRWQRAPIEHPDGTLEERTKGTPQGGVVSPLLANLFLHYAFDRWMARFYPDLRFERYADDGAPRRREEVRDVTSNSWQPCCTRDEGRPLGLGLRDQGPNHRKPRRSNGRGGRGCGTQAG